jgi:hypothetical protein
MPINPDTQNPDGTFKPGHPGGPGRAKGAGMSIKERINQRLHENPQELEMIVDYFIKHNKELLWQMLEGRPQQDVTSGGDKLIPNPIFGGLSKHAGDTQNILPEETNTSS